MLMNDVNSFVVIFLDSGNRKKRIVLWMFADVGLKVEKFFSCWLKARTTEFWHDAISWRMCIIVVAAFVVAAYNIQSGLKINGDGFINSLIVIIWKSKIYILLWSI